MSEIAVY